ncbi:MAG: carboxypeptidase regulatory-like domain-containing protein [Fimbriimonadaceae bacterium]|nr:carboxypeptidase regulatory-like domain-containing protein [Fimbriimonadaceae bacterium]QYK57549.1 MAG: carboxypeptidase regulatory-like domain-containing protein [Fimbriimonadaceae bacterium]
MDGRWLVLFALLGAVGCGGTTEKSSIVQGTVLDDRNEPVRDARVITRDGETRTSPTGAFSLTAVREGEVEVRAEAQRDGVLYRGRTTVFNVSKGRTPSVNIVIGRVDQLATVTGTVRDNGGAPLKGASVWAYFGAGSSQRAFTDQRGQYVLRDLVAGVEYVLAAGGQGFRSDTETVRLRVGERRVLNFLIGEAGIPILSPPRDLSVVTWVSPVESSRAPTGDPIEAVKRAFDPKRTSLGAARSKSRAPGGTLVESNLSWREQRFPDLAGYGIYRSDRPGDVLDGIDFLPDPLAAYYVDLDLRIGRTYSYAVTTISSKFPDFSNLTESGLSDVVSARTLDRLTALAPTLDPLTFRWRPVSTADEYFVLLFDEFPSVGVSPVWDNTSRPATGTSLRYDGPRLVKGQTYYYVVIGTADERTSRTISQIESLNL